MGSSKRSTYRYLSPLPWFERVFYFMVTTAIIPYICYCVYRDSLIYDGILNLYDFTSGWSWLGREQDISNFEWRFWYTIFWRVWPWYLGHVAFGKIAEWNSPRKRKYFFLAFSCLSLCLLIGWHPLCLLIVHAVCLYLVSLMSYTALVWIVSLALLSTLNFEPFITMMKSLVEDDEDEKWYYLLMFTLALTNIRSTSFCIEHCWCRQKTSLSIKGLPEDNLYHQIPRDSTTSKSSTTNTATPADSTAGEMGYSLMDMLTYTLYLPLFFTGPILTYNLFREQINAPLPDSTWSRVKFFPLHIVRFCFWAMFNEFILHFFYFNSLQQNTTVLMTVPLFTLAGLGFCHGQFFMIKYLVMFGLPGTVAKFDYLNPPPGPKCISYIYLYSDMWKYFDRGLYSFLKRYIYISCGGSRAGIYKQWLGSLLCFLYIYYWYGAEFSILMWIILNYIGVSMEKIGSLISSFTVIKHVQTDLLSAAMVQRIHTLCSIPIFLVSCFSMFCFFGGHLVGYIFFERLILEGWLGSYVILILLLYCAIHNAVEVNLAMCKMQKAKLS